MPVTTYLTRKESAKELRVSPSKISKFIDSGLLPAADVGCGKTASYRIRRTDLDQLVERLQHEPTSQAD